MDDRSTLMNSLLSGCPTGHPNPLSNILDEIIRHKREEIAAAQARRPLAEVRRAAEAASPPLDFVAALQSSQPMALIAEIKKASPSAGLIRADLDPVAIARIYVDHGAACLSVLTDEHFFQGHLDNLEAVRQAVDVPLLRKDFLIDPYQVWEARASGADCVLLIAECLDDEQLAALSGLAQQLGMATLVEIHEPDNLPRALALTPRLIGVNNRNLKTFVTDLQQTVGLRQQIPDGILVVGESGIHTREHVVELQQAGVNAILVGESLMRSGDIGLAVRRLLGGN